MPMPAARRSAETRRFDSKRSAGFTSEDQLMHGNGAAFRRLAFVAMVLVILAAAAIAPAGTPPAKCTGQSVYVPVYSHIYIGDKEYPFLLTATVSIRNTDPHQSITLLRVDYYDSAGQLVKSYLEQPLSLGTLASTRYVVRESDKSGGSGAKFLVQWQAKTAVSPPLMEAVMIGTQSAQGISFTSRGQVIEEQP